MPRLRRIFGRGKPGRHVGFRDYVSDPVFGLLSWQGYADGDWWSGHLGTEDGRIEFLIGGYREPDPDLVRRAHEISANYDALTRDVSDLLLSEAEAHPEQAGKILRLRVTGLALFAPVLEPDPDEYAGEFVILRATTDSEEWRCDIRHGTPVDLRSWDT